jgi:hypothetical protein
MGACPPTSTVTGQPPTCGQLELWSGMERISIDLKGKLIFIFECEINKVLFFTFYATKN